MGDYCSLPDVRAEGLTEARASDARVAALISEWSAWIDQITGQFFDERVLTLEMSGQGTRNLLLPIPPTPRLATPITEIRRVWRLADPDTTLVIDSDLYRVYNRTFPDDRRNPRVELLGDGRWERGPQNFALDGTWGFVEADGTTPRPIKRAAILLVLHHAGQLGDQYEAARRREVDLRSRTVVNRTETYGGPTSSGTISGVPEVDRILTQYRAPMQMAVA